MRCGGEGRAAGIVPARPRGTVASSEHAAPGGRRDGYPATIDDGRRTVVL